MNNIYAVCLGLSLLFLFSGVENNTPSFAHPDIFISVKAKEQRNAITINKAKTNIHVQDLIPGNEYVFHFSNAYENDKVHASISPLGINLLGSNDRTLQFIAKGEKANLILNYDGDPKSANIFLSISDNTPIQRTRKKSPTSEKSFVNPPTIVTNLTIEELVTDVFVQAACFEVENIEFTGAAGNVGIAKFEDAQTFEFKQGVIMGNFNVTQVVGPNTSTGTGGFIGGTLNDPDLQDLAGGIPINDGQILEFDFVPTVDKVQFNYVWGSEEYCDYVDVAFNDVFGFFISGPGISGPYTNNSENIALIPGTSTPVSINEVNWNDNSEYYITNDVSGGGTCTPEEIAADPAAPDDLELDGWTTKLTAIADVIPCETYHIKLAIGDGQDAVFGSAVFLEANSFFTGDAIEFDVVYSSPESDFVYENCNNDEACIVFSRPEGIPDTVDVSIPITEDATSVATEGVDYQFLPDTIVFPAGEVEVQFCLEVIDDEIIEGIEAAIFVVEGICACDDPLVEININDVPILDPLITGPTEVCENESFDISISVNSDAPPEVTYMWSNGNSTNSFSDQISETTTYSVTVTDGCNQEEIREITVEVIPEPGAILSGEGILCATNNDCVELTIDFTGTGPWNVNYTFNGQNNFLNNINNNPYTFNVCEPGTYTLTAVDAFNCVGTAEGEVVLEETLILLDITSEDALCIFEPSGNIDLTVNDGVEPYSFSWDPPLGDVEDPVNVPAGTYTVTVTDANNCTQVSQVEVGEPTELVITNIEVTPVGCEGPNSGGINITVAGGTGPYSYDWNDPLDDIEDQDSLQIGAYQVTVIDDNDCQVISDFILVQLDNSSPVALAGPDTSLTCNFNMITLEGLASSPQGDPIIEWTTSDGNIVSGGNTTTPQIDAPGTYTLSVSNPDGSCTIIDNVVVSDNTEAPEVDAGPQLELNCQNQTINLAASGESNIDVLWTTNDGNIVSGADSLNPVVSSPGTYTITATSQITGCISTDEVTIGLDTVSPVSTIADADILTCLTLEVTLSGEGSSEGPEYEYEWSTQNGIIVGEISSLNINVRSPGTYTFLVRNTLNGCDDSESIEVIEEVDTLDISINPPSILTCNTTEISLDASGSEQNSNSVFNWTVSNGGNITSANDTDVISVNSPGIYTLSLVDTLTGCISEQSIEVLDDLTAPVADAGTAEMLTCFVTEVSLNGSSNLPEADTEFSWTTNNGSILSGANTANPVVSQAGMYYVLVEYLPTGCFALDSIEVIADENIPQVEIVSTDPELTCNTSVLNLDIDLSGNVDQFDIEWTPDGSGNIVSGGNTENPLIDQPGIYTVTIIDTVLGCITSASVEVEINTVEPIANAGAPDSLSCIDLQLNLDASLSSIGANYSYSWTTIDGNIVSGGDQINPIVDQSGTYELMVTDNSNGCTSTDQVFIDLFDENPLAIAEVNDVLSCTLENVVLNGSMSIGNGPLAYDWTTTDGNIVTGSDLEFPVVNQAGTYTLVVTNLANGCTSETVVTVDEDIEEPVSNIAAPDLLTCDQTSLILDGSMSSSGNEYQYSWTTTNGNIMGSSTNQTVEINQTGEYTLLVTDISNGCTSLTTVNVDEDITEPDAIIEAPDILTCEIENVLIDATGSSSGNDFIYEWSFQGNIVGNSNTLDVTEPGIYEFLVVNQNNGCETLSTIEVFEDRTDPEAQFDANSPGCDEITGTINLSALQGTPPFEVSLDGGNSFSPDVSFSNLSPGIYDVILKDATGCAISQQLEIIENIPIETSFEANSVIIPFGDSYQIDLDINLPSNEINSISWSPDIGLSCTQCEDPIASPLQTTEYTVTVLSDKGCLREDQVIIRVDNEPSVYVPTVFSPNNDGTNDRFTLFAKDGQVNTVLEMRIYDRWGNLLFENENFPPNDENEGWDGTFNNEVLNPGVYVFYAILELVDGRKYPLAGDVTLVN